MKGVLCMVLLLPALVAADMTGAVAIGATSPSGFWSIQQDATTPGTIWKQIAWNGSRSSDRGRHC